MQWKGNVPVDAKLFHLLELTEIRRKIDKCTEAKDTLALVRLLSGFL